MSKLVLEIGFLELMVAVIGAALMGVLLMVLYHRLAMRRERELMQRRVDNLARAVHAPEIAPPADVAATVIVAENTDCLDFHSPKPGA